MKLKKLIKDELDFYSNEDKSAGRNETEEKINNIIAGIEPIDPYFQLNYLELEGYGAYRLLRAYNEFWYSPNQESFQKVVDSCFLIYSGCVIGLKNNEIERMLITPTSLSSSFLSTLLFLEKKEHCISYDFFTAVTKKYLKNKYSSLRFQDTIDQYIFLVFDKLHPNNDGLWMQYINKPLHPIYQDFWDNLYMDDIVLLNTLVDKMCEYHISKSHSFKNNQEFSIIYWQLIATEILAPLRLRYLEGKEMNISNELVSKLVPFIQVESFVLSPKMQAFKEGWYKKFNI